MVEVETEIQEASIKKIEKIWQDKFRHKFLFISKVLMLITLAILLENCLDKKFCQKKNSLSVLRLRLKKEGGKSKS
jgi:hypothetical protein